MNEFDLNPVGLGLFQLVKDYHDLNSINFLHISGESTNFGLLNKLRSKWADQVADETHADFNTTYGISYSAMPGSTSGMTRYATPKDGSSTLHPLNRVNKDLHFRGMPFLQAPEALQKPPLPAGI